MIPKVKSWQVSFWLHGKLIGRCFVDAPTRTLARLNIPYLPGRFRNKADRLTITLNRNKHDFSDSDHCSRCYAEEYEGAVYCEPHYYSLF